MPKGDRSDFNLAPLVSLPEMVVRATIDPRADLAAMAAAEDMVPGLAKEF